MESVLKFSRNKSKNNQNNPEWRDDIKPKKELLAFKLLRSDISMVSLKLKKERYSLEHLLDCQNKNKLIFPNILEDPLFSSPISVLEHGLTSGLPNLIFERKLDITKLGVGVPVTTEVIERLRRCTKELFFDQLCEMNDSAPSISLGCNLMRSPQETFKMFLYHLNPIEVGRLMKKYVTSYLLDSETAEVIRRDGSLPNCVYQAFSRFHDNMESMWLNAVLLKVQDFVFRMNEFYMLVFSETMNAIELYDLFQIFYGLYLVDKLIPNLKYAINLIHNDFYDLEPPKGDETFYGYDMFPLRMQKTFLLWIKQRSYKRNSKRVLMNSLFQGLKKAFLPAQENSIAVTINSHCNALTVERKTSPYILDDLEDILRRCFPKEIKFPTDSEVSSTVSIRSCNQMGCRGNGSYGFAYLMDNVSVTDIQKMKDRVDADINYSFNEYAFRMTINSRISNEEFICFVSKKHKSTDPIEIRANCGVLRETLKLYRKLWDPTRRVVPAFILEPFKARTITKSDAMAYEGMKPIQQALWKFLKSHHTGFFDLIGETVTTDHLWPIACSWQPGKKFVSGDYSGATDSLHGDVSKLVTKWLIRNLFFTDPELYQRILDTMNDSQLDYQSSLLPKTHVDILDLCEQKKPGLLKEKKDQRNGQLMGHIISFPILCVTNYIIYHYSLERSIGKRLSMNDVKNQFPVLINGDDIAFCCERERYSLWMHLIQSVGFYPSLGKNHFSDKIMQINSKTFYMSTLVTEIIESVEFTHGYSENLIRFVYSCVPKLVGYVNFGIINCRKKGKSEETETDGMSDLYSRLYLICELYEEVVYAIRGVLRNNSILKNINYLFECHFARYRKMLPGIKLPWECDPTPREIIRKCFTSEGNLNSLIISKYGINFDHQRTFQNTFDPDIDFKRKNFSRLIKDRAPFPALTPNPVVDEFSAPVCQPIKRKRQKTRRIRESDEDDFSDEIELENFYKSQEAEGAIFLMKNGKSCVEEAFS